MKEKLSFKNYFVIGIMLFALFFGAGNLIFPAQLGQNAGSNLWPALFGFLITGVGLPLLGILAMGVSGSSNLQELASRVHPVYGLVFTALLYLTIGPFFAIPRTGTASFEIGISTFLSDGSQHIGLIIYSIIFFGVTLWLSLNPSKIVDRVGKILAPGIVVLLGITLILAVIHPISAIQAPQEAFANGPFVKGFLEGYNTMDALASLVFGIIVIHSVKDMGVTSKKGVLSATVKAGVVAISFLAIIYVGIGYLGATSVEKFGLFDTGGPVLSSGFSYYFGTLGAVILAIVVILACLTTSIGLVTSCAEYFNTLFPKVSYQKFAVFFSIISFIIANFGLANIIKFSVPVLMFLYPLAIVLMILTFLSPLFNHSRIVYASAIGVTFLVSIIDGFKTFCDSIGINYFGWLDSIISFYQKTLPLYGQGLGWLIPALVVILLTGIYARVSQTETVEA